MTGDWIREEMASREWKVDDLSYASHIPARLIWKYLQGTEPGARNLARILIAFGYDVPWNRKTRVFFEAAVARSLEGVA